MTERKKSNVAILLDYAGSHKGLTLLGLALSAVSMLLSMVPYFCMWLVARDLIAVAPDWTQAQDIIRHDWPSPSRWAVFCCTLRGSCAPTWRPSALPPTSESGCGPGPHD